jgi:Icc-related predicted phosphoesterase
LSMCIQAELHLRGCLAILVGTTMRLLCIADHVDPFIYSAGLKARYGNVDLVLSAGDLTLGYYDFVVSNLNKPLLFVFGNHHLEQMRAFGKRADPFVPPKTAWEGSGGATCLEGRVKRIKGLIVAGLGGSIWYNGGENQFTDFTMLLAMLKLLPLLLWHRAVHGRFLDVLLTHAPPYGINDLPDPCHTGFRVFLWFMRTFKPQYLVHGHVHLYDRNAAREARYGATTIVNAYDHTVIEMETAQ